MTPRTIRRMRDRISLGLMALLAAGALVAFAHQLGRMDAYEGARAATEAWRLLAYPVFAALFLMLGFFPRRTPGLWEAAFLHKAGMALLLLLVFTDAGEDRTLMIATDFTLAGVLLAGYLLTRGWRAWLAFREPHRGEPG